jgi:hypothetical protein
MAASVSFCCRLVGFQRSDSFNNVRKAITWQNLKVGSVLGEFVCLEFPHFVLKVSLLICRYGHHTQASTLSLYTTDETRKGWKE